ncbi:MAG: helix-turn-helix domain-containing protein, partial [Solirubrobacteraceae bacterium]
VWADGVKSGRLPTSADRAAIERYVERWTATLLPLELIARSFQIGARRVVALAQNVADDLRLGAPTLLALQDRAWQWATLNMAVVGDVQRTQQVAAARRDGALRAALIAQLRGGRSTPEELADVAALLGLDPEHGYVAVVGTPDTAGLAEAGLRRSGATTALRVVHAVVDGRLFALAPGEPRLGPGVVESPIGVGRRRAIAEAHLSFAEAEHAERTAAAFGIAGLVDLEMLAPLPMVTSTERLAEYAATRRFAPLDALGRPGIDVERTVLAFFEHDQSIDATARVLHVHRNTVRHRLGRFRDLTGLDIAHTDELVTAWWLLRHREAQRAPAPTGDGA